MSLVIRPMEQGDLARCAAIEATAADAWSAGQLEEELADQTAGGPARLFCALFDDVPAGLAVFQLAAGEASLYALTVDPSLRRKGIGGQLLSQSLAALQKEGAESCFLEVRSQNLAAQALYSALGFQTAGRRKGFYKNPDDDALVMTLVF